MGKLRVLIILAGVFAVAYGVGRVWDLKPEGRYDHIIRPGERAVLTSAGTDRVWVALEKEGAYPLQKAMAEKDGAFLQQAVSDGKAFVLPLGTRVEVTGQSANKRRLQVVEGPDTGKAGWVEFEYLRPLQRGER